MCLCPPFSPSLFIIIFLKTTLRCLWTSLWLLTNQFSGEGNALLLVALGSSLPLTAERRLDDAPPAPRDPPTSGLHAAFFLLRKAVSLAFQSRPAARLRFMGPELLTDRLFHALSLALRAAGPGLRLRAAATRWGRAAERRPRGGGEEARGRLPVFVTLTQGAGSLVPGNSPGTVASAHVCSYALEERSWTLGGVGAGGGRECVYPPTPGACAPQRQGHRALCPSAVPAWRSAGTPSPLHPGGPQPELVALWKGSAWPPTSRPAWAASSAGLVACECPR